jgi:aspartate racemase
MIEEEEVESMRSIGIVDITTVGACICANEIVIYSKKVLPNEQHPEFVMHAFSYDEYKALVLAQNWEELAKLITQSVKKLQAAGASFAIMPSNTPHYCYNYLTKSSPIPILDLIQLSVDHCKKQHIRKVAVLGTKFTMQGELYTSKLAEADIEQITLSAEDIILIDNLIMNELIPSKVIPANVERVRQIILKLDCEGVILGCTELPEVYNEMNLPNKKIIDTTRLLAHAAVDFARGIR